MDGKTKFLVSLVALATVYGIGMSFYKFIIVKDIELHYTQEEEVEGIEEGVEETVADGNQPEEGIVVEVESQATSTIASTSTISVVEE